MAYRGHPSVGDRPYPSECKGERNLYRPVERIYRSSELFPGIECRYAYCQSDAAYKGRVGFWINKQGLVRPKFEWADEYFTVCVSETALDYVRIKTRYDTPSQGNYYFSNALSDAPLSVLAIGYHLRIIYFGPKSGQISTMLGNYWVEL